MYNYCIRTTVFVYVFCLMKQHYFISIPGNCLVRIQLEHEALRWRYLADWKKKRNYRNFAVAKFDLFTVFYRIGLTHSLQIFNGLRLFSEVAMTIITFPMGKSFRTSIVLGSTNIKEPLNL